MSAYLHSGSTRTRWTIMIAALVVLGGLAWSRMGLLNLPAVPENLSLAGAGLAHLAEMQRLDRHLRSQDPSAQLPPTGPADAAEAIDLVRKGIAETGSGDPVAGLAIIRRGIELAPTDLVLLNAYRMTVFHLRCAFLKVARWDAMLVPEFPAHLADEPIAFLAQLDAKYAAPEIRLNLALAWVDRMLQFPALEIKAPASVQAVHLLTDLIEGGHPGYVPALFARGLNHIHRPARLVWPESFETPPDAGVRDVAMCVAIGRKLGAGSDRLRATLAMTLGDAYVKTGELGSAHSWWQVARNLSDDPEIHDSIRRRFGWRDDDALDLLEAELDRTRAQLDRPMTDLAMMWN